MNPWLLYRRLRNARRVRELGRIVFKYGLGPYLTQLGLRRLWGRLKGTSPAPEVSLTLPERMCMALQEMGPTAIKFGQMLSTRHDLLPPQYIEQLEKLQDEVSPLPFEVVREELERELQAPLAQMFREINPQPLASASIGQVHSATLLSGERVALKVQRPDVERIVERDLAILFDLAEFLQRRARLARHYDLVQVVKEFAEGIRDQLVYTIEARNAEQVASHLADDSRVYIPSIYWGLTTRHVLAMELVEGIKISDVEELRAAGHDLPQLAQHLAQLTLRQMLSEGVFHADPHPGNFIVLPNGKIGIVDFGIVGRFDPATRSQLVDVFTGIVSQDVDRVTNALTEMGFTTEDTPLAPFRHDLGRLLTRYLSLPRKEFRLGELLRRLLGLMHDHSIVMPAEFTLVAQTLVMVEGICLSLNPDFEIREMVEPMVWRVLGAQLEPGQLVKDLVESVRQLSHLIHHLPRQVSSLLSQAEMGELKIRTEIHRVDQILTRASSYINRLSFSIVVSAIILATALLLQQMPNFPLRTHLGVLGFLTSAALGFWLLVSILRSGRL